MRIDYVALEVRYAKARRARAEAVYQLLIAPIVRLFKPSAARPVLRSRLA